MDYVEVVETLGGLLERNRSLGMCPQRVYLFWALAHCLYLPVLHEVSPFVPPQLPAMMFLLIIGPETTEPNDHGVKL
jgi:hypothetical protein